MVCDVGDGDGVILSALPPGFIWVCACVCTVFRIVMHDGPLIETIEPWLS